MKSIRMKLITYFLVVILCVCLITGVVVTATTKSVLKNNIELTSSQTVTETLKGFHGIAKYRGRNSGRLLH